MSSVYITAAGRFLPNEPVGNDQIEARLGMIWGKPSRIKRRILEHGGIEKRYYALDASGRPTHSSAQLAALAVRDAIRRSDRGMSDIDLLCAATATPDLLLPGFASMVHGLLPEVGPTETLSTTGGCCAAISGLSHAYAQVAIGRRRCALSVGSERFSALLRAERHEDAVEPGGELCFDAEFLRWMLSDGAGALLLEPAPARAGVSLRIDWIELISHAHDHPIGTYLGCQTNHPDTSWSDVSPATAAKLGYMSLRQDVRNIKKLIALLCSDFCRLVDAGRVSLGEIDHLLVHDLSRCVPSEICRHLASAGKWVPKEKWFTNLYTRGNIGNASLYLMLEQMWSEGTFQPGDSIVCLVPESDRYTTAYARLTAVDCSG